MYMFQRTTTQKKRHNRKIARPNGVPLLIEQAPERFGAQDFKVRAQKSDMKFCD